MRIVVLGGGVVAVATAYYLAKEGHEVTVVEEKSIVGSGASAGNAGMIAPGHSLAWASPRAPAMLAKSVFGAKTALRLKPIMSPRQWRFMVEFLRECTTEKARKNSVLKFRLASYSQGMLDELAQEERIEYQALAEGILYIYRSTEHLERGIEALSLLWDHGLKQEVLDPKACARLDPAFELLEDKIAGAVYGVTDATGSCELFTRNLAKVCEGLGVSFRLETRAQRMIADGDRVLGVATDEGILTADIYVLSAGIHSPAVARTVGVRLPIYPAKGFSATFPVRDEHVTPSMSYVDEEFLVATSPLGEGLRMTSTSVFAGYEQAWKPDDFSNILRVAQDLFPDAADYSGGKFTACLRPMTPEGTPIIGRGWHKNLYFNTGHGHIGWTMACGSARICADMIVGRKPDIDVAGLAPR